MDLLNVFVIIGEGYDREKVVDEIHKEGYTHNFYFDNNEFSNSTINFLNQSNEVWIFGKVDYKENKTYEYALFNDYDIWYMR